MRGTVEFDAVAAHAAADRLDALADGLEQNMRQHGHALDLAPAAVDEVSRHAERTFNAVGASYRRAYANGVHELRSLAASLRGHASAFRHADAESASALSR
jgi:PE family